ncbi:LLM class flavin-dependent oxidoreductase [Trujillonella endophytica]|uniref:F420-dependent oxidoreductase, MSMEG_4879 family n=1 Tax=Trujillonella endophytica TaxID=673521 RepID=A0A1H8Q5Z2_9ACTN|nr:LLM class flavin-dependent oxidoreductase [Trujillella endophytica]SEO49645.1 F420-dependent oxidoreductase, MSMEG_4879 family [Trujillella endophytica]
MRIAIHSALTNYGSLDDVVAEVRRTADAGLAGYWAPMLGGQDTLTALAIAGREVPGVELGTAVVPMPLRGPFALAQQVRTVQEAVGGRLVLGLGTSHEAVTRDLFGEPWRPPLAAAREHLAQLLAILGGEGDRRLAGAPALHTDVLLGAVNPAMVALAVELGSGVVTWSAGEATLRDVVGAAVRGSGRTGVRVVAALPVTVTDDEAAARGHVQRRLGANDRFPSYRKVLEREGVAGVADLAVVGTAAQVRDRLAGFAGLGVTDFAAHVTGPDAATVEATWALLADLAAGSS